MVVVSKHFRIWNNFVLQTFFSPKLGQVSTSTFLAQCPSSIWNLLKHKILVHSGNTKMHFPDTEVFILLGAINSGWKYYVAAPKKSMKFWKESKNDLWNVVQKWGKMFQWIEEDGFLLKDLKGGKKSRSSLVISHQSYSSSFLYGKLLWNAS